VLTLKKRLIHPRNVYTTFNTGEIIVDQLTILSREKLIVSDKPKNSPPFMGFESLEFVPDSRPLDSVLIKTDPVHARKLHRSILIYIRSLFHSISLYIIINGNAVPGTVVNVFRLKHMFLSYCCL
jgi:hypothetical protein